MKRGLEQSLASPQPDLAGIPLSFLSQDTGLSQAVVGFGGICLAFIGFPKGKWLSFSQEDPPCLWVRACHRDVGLWQSWLSKPASGVGLEGHEVISGEWQSFPSGTKDPLVLGGKD